MAEYSNDSPLRLDSPDLDDGQIHDVIIVGAGPCGLAVAARLRESNPAALFTDEEHRRFQWMKRHGRKMALKHVKGGRVSNAAPSAQPAYDMVVLDAEHDAWMGRWNRLFATYDIRHLRSHMLWHVDPGDRDSLLSKAYEQGRESELVEMKGCVGKELSKHTKKKRQGKFIGSKQDFQVSINERDRNDYFNPSQALFCDHCSGVVDRYQLGEGLIQRESLLDISYGSVNGLSVNDERLFTVRTSKGTRLSRVVVLAVGPGNAPRIPRLLSSPPQLSKLGHECLPQACHSMHIREFPDITVSKRVAAGLQTNVLVIGGGLTSAQLSDLALRKGVSKVWQLMRGPLRVKHFDVDLLWMGKFRNHEHSRFWQAESDEERLDLIKEARGGGSITPRFHKIVKQHIASGKLVLRENTTLVDATFEEDVRRLGTRGAWRIKSEPPIEDAPLMDYIYFATGIQTDFRALPYLQTMLRDYPIPGHGGFPCLNDDLMWKDGVPLFAAGRLAALRLGPAAPNLGGARLGAERISWAVEDIMSKAHEDGRYPVYESDGEDELIDYVTGKGSKFSSLSEASS
ncbi:hypothetical protein GQ53DRAFT_828948 [Thozetella sp. PMI_491]|nr:hypothetical protein GQ53DRAFT_828948 [Thozetella sp. PMI_491]